MWGRLIGILAVIVAVSTSVVLYMSMERLKTDTNKKFNDLVSQINNSQFYGFNFDKQQEQNIMNVDRNITSLNDAVLNLQKNLKQLDATTVKVDRKDIIAQSIQTNQLKLSDKYQLTPGNDEWVRLLNRTGSDYSGGLAAKNLWVGQNSYLNGSTNITGNLNISGNVVVNGKRI
jgi:hypothetical protein